MLDIGEVGDVKRGRCRGRLVTVFPKGREAVHKIPDLSVAQLLTEGLLQLILLRFEQEAQGATHAAEAEGLPSLHGRGAAAEERLS